MDEEGPGEQIFLEARTQQHLSSDASQLNPDDLALVTGARGFIGGHLVAELRRRGHRRLRAVDIKPFDRWFQRFDDADNQLRLMESQFPEPLNVGSDQLVTVDELVDIVELSPA